MHLRLQALNSNSWIRAWVCACVHIGWPTSVFFSLALSHSLHSVRAHSTIIFANHFFPAAAPFEYSFRTLVNSLLLLVLLLLLVPYSLYWSSFLSSFFFCSVALQQIVQVNFMQFHHIFSIRVLHFTNIYYGNIYAIQKPKMKNSDTLLTEPALLNASHLIKWRRRRRRRRKKRHHTLHQRAHIHIWIV